MRRFFIRGGVILAAFLVFCYKSNAQVIELACPVGTISVQPLQTTDTITGKLRQNYCIDIFGNVFENVTGSGTLQTIALGTGQSKGVNAVGAIYSPAAIDGSGVPVPMGEDLAIPVTRGPADWHARQEPFIITSSTPIAGAGTFTVDILTCNYSPTVFGLPSVPCNASALYPGLVGHAAGAPLEINEQCGSNAPAIFGCVQNDHETIAVGNFNILNFTGGANGLGQVQITFSQAHSAITGTETAASVTSNIATLTMSSNPQTVGFIQGQTVKITGFTGGDSFFNGTVVLKTVSSTSVTYNLIHANGSAVTNSGTVTQGYTMTQWGGIWLEAQGYCLYDSVNISAGSSFESQTYCVTNTGNSKNIQIADGSVTNNREWAIVHGSSGHRYIQSGKDGDHVQRIYARSGTFPNAGLILYGNESPTTAACGVIEIRSNDFDENLFSGPSFNTCNGSTNFKGNSVNNVGVFSLATNLLMIASSPTIAAAGCGGAAASIVIANGTAAFKINVGTTPGSTCTITMPTAATGWNVTCNDITTQSTSVFLQKQTGAESTTSVTISNFNDVAVATAFVANDILKCQAVAD